MNFWKCVYTNYLFSTFCISAWEKEMSMLVFLGLGAAFFFINIQQIIYPIIVKRRRVPPYKYSISSRRYFCNSPLWQAPVICQMLMQPKDFQIIMIKTVFSSYSFTLNIRYVSSGACNKYLFISSLEEVLDLFSLYPTDCRLFYESKIIAQKKVLKLVC